MSSIENHRFDTENLELGSGPTGCYLIHGFTGTTYELRGLAHFLADQGYRVSARLLPGHGTTMEECNLVKAEDWLEEVEYHFTDFMLDCEAAFVIGLSMGAGLALHLAALFPLAGVVAMSPALVLPSWKLRLLPVTSRFKPILPKAQVYADRNPDQHLYYGYPGYPAKALWQMLRLHRHIRAELGNVTAPALIMHSHADITAPFVNARLVHETIASTDKELVEFEQSSHMLPDDTEKEAVWRAIGEFVAAHIPQQADALPVP